MLTLSSMHKKGPSKQLIYAWKVSFKQKLLNISISKLQSRNLMHKIADLKDCNCFIDL